MLNNQLNVFNCTVMAHTDPFIFLPIVFWVFISFWFIYILVTTYFFPAVYKSFRTRLLTSNYFNNELYVQMWSVLGFYVIFEKALNKYYSVVLKFFRSIRLILIIKMRLSLLKIKYVSSRVRKTFIV